MIIGFVGEVLEEEGLSESRVRENFMHGLMRGSWRSIKSTAMVVVRTTRQLSTLLTLEGGGKTVKLLA